MNPATLGAMYLGAGSAVLLFLIVFVYVWLTKVRPELKLKRNLENQTDLLEDEDMADGWKDGAERVWCFRVEERKK